jgi:hypothetical protein
VCIAEPVDILEKTLGQKSAPAKAIPAITCSYINFEPDSVCQNIAWDESNERYSASAISMLRNIDGIDAYIGVCGGFTQNMLIIGALQEKNMLRTIDIFDIDKNQLTNASKLARQAAMPSYLAAEMERFNIIQFAMKVKLEIRSLAEKIDAISEYGKYFIYLSNVVAVPFKGIGSDKKYGLSYVGGYTGSGIVKGNETLKQIASNEFILDGSYVMASSPSWAVLLNDKSMNIYSDVMIIKKERQCGKSLMTYHFSYIHNYGHVDKAWENRYLKSLSNKNAFMGLMRQFYSNYRKLMNLSDIDWYEKEVLWRD